MACGGGPISQTQSAAADAPHPAAPAHPANAIGSTIVEHSRGRTNDSGYKNVRPATEAIVASNQKLAKDAPKRRSAPSSHVRMNFHDSHSETMRQAMLLADHAHDAEGMKQMNPRANQ